jgi:hypothetical protein
MHLFGNSRLADEQCFRSTREVFLLSNHVKDQQVMKVYRFLLLLSNF